MHSTKGWLTLRTGPLLLTSERYFFRLQWGFLSQYVSERSAAMQRYCVHASVVDVVPQHRKISLMLGPLGVLTAHGTDPPSEASETVWGRKMSTETDSTVKKTRSPAVYRRTSRESLFVKCGPAKRDRKIHQVSEVVPRKGTTRESTTHRLVLIADTYEDFETWATKLFELRSRNIARWYKTETLIGAGAAGRVFKAKSLSRLDFRVAVKCIEYHFAGHFDYAVQLRRIQKEVQTQFKASTSSPYVVRIFDVFFDSRYVYVVMEYVPGGCIREWMEVNNNSMPENSVITLTQQILLTLLNLHRHNIVHRDIKADNCLLELDESNLPKLAKLTDFGFAEVFRQTHGSSINSFCTGFLGTATYMAPEIARFDPYGAPVDMFALGILCHYMLTGEYPYEAETIEQTVKEIQKGDLQRLRERRDVSNDARSFCLALLQADPAKRLTAAAALQHKWVRRGRDVTKRVLRRQSCGSNSRNVLRRVVLVINAARALQIWASMPPPESSPVPEYLLDSRQAMLRELDSKLKEQGSFRAPKPILPHDDADWT